MTAERDTALLGERPPLPLADDARLDEALHDAQVSTLLLSYVHLTHDEAMLDRFAPHLQRVLLQRPEHIPPDLAAELRSKMHAVLTGQVAPEVTEPSAELLRRMMEVSVGEPVADEFVPLLYDQIGLRPDRPRVERPGRSERPNDLRVMVIGLGLAGIATAIRLIQAGYEPVIVERNPDLSGTWYSNTYPGVGVDTSSHFYSFSFAQWPHWTHFKPKGREMREYFSAVAEHHDLRRRTRFSTTLVAAAYDEAGQAWEVRLRGPDGEVVTERVDVLINAGGFSHRPKYPDIPGLDTFAGTTVHTARWDRDVDATGKRVAVIGTGASGVQVVPELAGVASHVDVFMRSRHWVLNNRETDVAISRGMRDAIERFPHYLEWWRFRIYWVIGDGQYVNVLRDPEWDGNMLAVSAVNERMRQFAIDQMQEALADRPDLYERVLPDFPIFSKRIIAHPTWWDTLRRDDVELVDAADLARQRRRDPHHRRDDHPCDVIVLADRLPLLSDARRPRPARDERPHARRRLGRRGSARLPGRHDSPLPQLLPHGGAEQRAQLRRRGEHHRRVPGQLHRRVPRLDAGRGRQGDRADRGRVEGVPRPDRRPAGAHDLEPSALAQLLPEQRRTQLHVVAVPNGRLLERHPRPQTGALRAGRPRRAVRLRAGHPGRTASLTGAEPTVRPGADRLPRGNRRGRGTSRS